MAYLLSLVTFLPVVAVVIVLLMPRRQEHATKLVTLGATVVTFAISLPLYFRFDPTSADYQFVEQKAWIPSLGVSYHLGVDGISVLLVLLTTFLMPLVILSSWTSVESRWKEFAVTMLLLEAGMVGVFVALDLFLFYVFWEAMLIPMYLIIGIWGGQQPDLRGGQVHPLYAGRLAPDAGRHPGAVLPARRRHQRLHLRPAGARPLRAARAGARRT